MIFPSAAATRIRGPSCIDLPTADQDYSARPPRGCPPSAARCTLLLFMLVLNLRLGADKLIIFLARNTLALPPGYVDAGCPVAG